MKRFIFNFLIPVAIVGGGVAGAAVLVRTAKSAEPEVPEKRTPTVEVQRVEVAPRQALIRGNGRVEAARRLTLSPQLNGRLKYLDPSVVVGGRVLEGQVLARIEPQDYRAAVEREKNALAAAERDLEVERARARAAEREWKLLGDANADAEASAVVRREPQRDAAKANLSAAKAALSKARTDLSRTTIRAPFDATVLSESVEEGQFVNVGAQLATLMATDQVWVRIAVPVEQLQWISIPGFGAEEGSPARVVQRLGDEATRVWEGRVLRLVTELEAETRRAQLIIAVDNPFEVAAGEIPLLPEAFVEAQLDGRQHPSIAKVPRAAVFAGNQVWTVDAEDRLRQRSLKIAWSDADHVYASEGLEDGSRVVMGEPKLPVEGMKVNTRDAGETAAANDEANAAAPAEEAAETPTPESDDEGQATGAAGGVEP